MACVFKNGNRWWLKARHPVTKETFKVSLRTRDRYQAELILRKFKAWEGLFVPEFGLAEFPETMAPLVPYLPEAFEALANGNGHLKEPPDGSEMGTGGGLPPGPVAAGAMVSRRGLGEIVCDYYRYCLTENDPHHARSKGSILRAAFGPGATEEGAPLDGPLMCGYLDDLGVSDVQAFIDTRPGRKGKLLALPSRRHYREVFVGLMEFAIRRNDYVPTNVRYPNVFAAGLPSYNERNRVIVYLTQEEIDQQLEMLQPYPVVRAAVATMIFAGPRRAEALWLRRDSIRDGRFLAIRNLRDEESGDRSSLKTGSRPVTIVPELAAIYDAYLPTLQGPWLFPSPKGYRWDKDNFSSALSRANKAAKLPWSAMHYRHTYATQRAAAGVSVFALAREMGTSVGMIEKHYAAFFPPEALR